MTAASGPSNLGSDLMLPTRRMIFSAPLLADRPGPARAWTNQQRGVAALGFEVVSCYAEGRARRGSAWEKQVFGGAEWLFASEAHRARFASAPEDLAPRLRGFCALGGSEGYLVEVDPEAGRWSRTGST